MRFITLHGNNSNTEILVNPARICMVRCPDKTTSVSFSGDDAGIVVKESIGEIRKLLADAEVPDAWPGDDANPYPSMDTV